MAGRNPFATASFSAFSAFSTKFRPFGQFLARFRLFSGFSARFRPFGLSAFRPFGLLSLFGLSARFRPFCHSAISGSDRRPEFFKASVRKTGRNEFFWPSAPINSEIRSEFKTNSEPIRKSAKNSCCGKRVIGLCCLHENVILSSAFSRK